MSCTQFEQDDIAENDVICQRRLWPSSHELESDPNILLIAGSNIHNENGMHQFFIINYPEEALGCEIAILTHLSPRGGRFVTFCITAKYYSCTRMPHTMGSIYSYILYLYLRAIALHGMDESYYFFCSWQCLIKYFQWNHSYTNIYIYVWYLAISSCSNCVQHTFACFLSLLYSIAETLKCMLVLMNGTMKFNEKMRAGRGHTTSWQGVNEDCINISYL